MNYVIAAVAVFAALFVASHSGTGNAQATSSDPLEQRVALIESCLKEAVPMSLRPDGALVPTTRKGQKHIWVAVVQRSCMNGTRDLDNPKQLPWPWKR